MEVARETRVGWRIATTEGTGSKCVKAPTYRCLKLCTTDGDCRAGYACTAEPDAAGHGSVNVCFPQ